MLTRVLAWSVVALPSLPDAPHLSLPLSSARCLHLACSSDPPIPSKAAPQPLSSRVTWAAHEGLPPLPDVI